MNELKQEELLRRKKVSMKNNPNSSYKFNNQLEAIITIQRYYRGYAQRKKIKLWQGKNYNL